MPSTQVWTASCIRAWRANTSRSRSPSARASSTSLPARGAIGTMPAVELAELHVALFAAHRTGDRRAVRAWFNRMLPVLNLQAVFRWALTKEVLRRRGVIAHAGKRAAGPELDAGDHR